HSLINCAFVQGNVRLLSWRLAARPLEPVAQRLGPLVVIVFDPSAYPHSHRISVVRHGPADARGTRQCGGKNPTGEHTGELLDDLLIIGGNGVAVAIQLSSTVLILQESADGKKLQNFSRIIFIRLS